MKIKTLNNENKNIIYLDNSATTQIDDRVVELFPILNKDFYANPSSMHRLGFNAEKKQDEYLEEFVKSIGVNKDEIIFTSCGTESNNLAIKGVVNTYKKYGKHIITTKVEHPSVLNVFRDLENENYDVTYLDVDNDGRVNIDILKDSIREDTVLVSIMHINNEIGSINDIENIGKIIKEKNQNTFFHTDMVQSFGKYFLNIKEAKIDLFSASSHKFYGPKGVGVLYKNKNVRIKPELLGGGQQNNLRSGTVNTFGNIMMMKAYLLMVDEKEKIYNNVHEVYNHFIDGLNYLKNKYDNIFLNSKNNNNFSKYIVNASFKGIRSEVLLHSLEEDNIYVSSGSACATHKKTRSDTLSAIGLNNDLIDSAIRFSFGKYNNMDEIDIVISSLDKKIEILRKYHR